MEASSSFLGLILFIMSTLLYFVFKMMYGKDVYDKDEFGDVKRNNDGSPKILYTAKSIKRKIFFLYFLIVIISQLIVNISVLNLICQTSIASVAFPAIIYTIIPWILIFGVIKVVLVLLPGWKAPFSNTFGYLIALIFGLKTTVREVLKPMSLEDDDKVLEGDQLKSFQTLREIYKDDSILINEITPENFDNFWRIMLKSQLIKTEHEVKQIPGKNLTLDKLRGNLQWFVGLKDDISEMIWFLLSGSLISTVVYNNISQYKCEYSASDIMAQDAKYKQSLDKQEKETEAGKNKIYYSSQ